MNPFDIRFAAQISAAGVKRLRRGHLWVYAGDVLRGPEDPASPLVKVIDQNGNTQGHAFHSPHSQIRLRLLSRDSAAPTPGFIQARVKASIERRRSAPGSRDACRLVFGEGDLLPSIIVDRYRDYLVLQTLSYGADAIKPQLVDMLTDLLKPGGVVERNDVRTRLLEGLDETSGILSGTVPDEVIISENGLLFAVSLLHGQKTGFFLDQRENRLAAAGYASGKALDCFTNTGAFALHFARCCHSVLAVDISAESAAIGRKNAALNGIANVDFQVANVFDLLRELEKAGESFDLICLDPPAFAKNQRALEGARSGYKEINLRALRLLRPEGVLVTSSCSYHLSEAAFFELLAEAARDARRYIQVIERRGQASDHPVLAGMPETHYLKCFVLRAVS